MSQATRRARPGGAIPPGRARSGPPLATFRCPGLPSAGARERGRSAQGGPAGRVDRRDESVMELGAAVVGQAVDGRALAVAPGEAPVGFAVGHGDRGLQRLPGDVGEPSSLKQVFLVRVVGPEAEPATWYFCRYCRTRSLSGSGHGSDEPSDRPGVVNANSPPGRSIRLISATAATGSGRMCMAKPTTTRSKASSGKSSAAASITRVSTAGRSRASSSTIRGAASTATTRPARPTSSRLSAPRPAARSSTWAFGGRSRAAATCRAKLAKNGSTWS